MLNALETTPTKAKDTFLDDTLLDIADISAVLKMNDQHQLAFRLDAALKKLRRLQ